MDNITWVDFDLLETFMKEVFTKIGIPEKDAEICANVLITSDKRGIDSHGIGRFKPIYIDRIKTGQINPVTKIDIVREAPATAVLDGNNGMGQVVSHKAMTMAIDKAKKYGIGMVAVRNSNHYGIAGYWPLMAIEHDMIGITGTNARPSIAPTFGVENMMGTNPMTFGIPTDEEFPFVLDCATSVSQRGKIETLSRLGKPTPEGWVIDRNGEYMTDSDAILKALVDGEAALVPVGGQGEITAGYKGYGYAAVVEILSAALQHGAYMKMLTGLTEKGEKDTYKLGHFFIAMDIASFTEPDDFKKTAGDIVRALRNSKKAPGAERIWTAGEKEHDAWLYRKDKGAKVDEVLKNQIIELRKEFGLEGKYTFPFDK